ncbi:Conserved hypothetical protein [Shewanella piezotolerans WP3]|uniref:Uncharacterized protein n=1 Tax=Shewanella piezotolerans (strain WP3 / JCM 13877) TaxID=225849 RepID=B8CK20_SHEPW|nr:Conserved hypothetical protein [Shewanella piezotolerans WP3]
MAQPDNEKFITEFASQKAALLRGNLNISGVEMLKSQRNEFSEFTQLNESRWQTGFDLLETHIRICIESGVDLHRNMQNGSENEDLFLFTVLLRHHARACHISNEILCLLKNGFSDAAHARWRALHEVNVTAMFIDKHGEECARRFDAHEIIDCYDGMKEHKKFEHRLNSKAPEQSIIDNYKIMFDAAKKEFGKGFETHYGWAAIYFPDRTPKSVGFRALEQDVELEHMRPYYKMASQNVHAGSKGTKSRLALSECEDDVLIVGQSSSGMCDPAHSTALSLMQITLTLLKFNPNIDNVVLMNLLRKYAEDIGDAFKFALEKSNSD